MENFFYEDEFYSELSDLLDRLDLNDEDIADLPDDYKLECKESVLEPLVTLTSDWVSENISEERFPEDNDSISYKVSKALEQIDFTKANEMMPKLYYATRTKFVITKKDILDYIN